MEETLFLGLRMTAGVSEQEFEHRFGKSLTAVYGSVIADNLRDGLLGWHPSKTVGQDRRLALTERGLDVSNYVMAQFLLT